MSPQTASGKPSSNSLRPASITKELRGITSTSFPGHPVGLNNREATKSILPGRLCFGVNLSGTPGDSLDGASNVFFYIKHSASLGPKLSGKWVAEFVAGSNTVIKVSEFQPDTIGSRASSGTCAGFLVIGRKREYPTSNSNASQKTREKIEKITRALQEAAKKAAKELKNADEERRRVKKELGKTSDEVQKGGSGPKMEVFLTRALELLDEKGSICLGFNKGNPGEADRAGDPTHVLKEMEEVYEFIDKTKESTVRIAWASY